MSRITAPVGLVTTPMTAGMCGIGCLRSLSKSPSAAAGAAFLELPQHRTFTGHFHRHDDLVFRAAAIDRQLAGDDDLKPLFRLHVASATVFQQTPSACCGRP